MKIGFKYLKKIGLDRISGQDYNMHALYYKLQGYIVLSQLTITTSWRPFKIYFSFKENVIYIFMSMKIKLFSHKIKFNFFCSIKNHLNRKTYDLKY